jgi:hypothetical protein
MNDLNNSTFLIFGIGVVVVVTVLVCAYVHDVLSEVVALIRAAKKSLERN